MNFELKPIILYREKRPRCTMAVSAADMAEASSFAFLGVFLTKGCYFFLFLCGFSMGTSTTVPFGSTIARGMVDYVGSTLSRNWDILDVPPPQPLPTGLALLEPVPNAFGAAAISLYLHQWISCRTLDWRRLGKGVGGGLLSLLIKVFYTSMHRLHYKCP